MVIREQEGSSWAFYQTQEPHGGPLSLHHDTVALSEQRPRIEDGGEIQVSKVLCRGGCPLINWSETDFLIVAKS